MSEREHGNRERDGSKENIEDHSTLFERDLRPQAGEARLVLSHRLLRLFGEVRR